MASEDGHRNDDVVVGPSETSTGVGVSSETLFVALGGTTPQRIGQYTLKRVIGSGSFGTVYEAMQDHPRRPVALKVMRRVTGTPSASALRRFQFESEILGRLHHPGIAQVYEAGVFDDGMGAVPYFVLEYIPNARTITEYAAHHHLTIAQRLELFARVCDAVYQPNLQGIVHRDLKPANILVDAQGQPKVIDFGVARATDSDLAFASQQTNVGELVGTLAYMSPEQIDADPHDIDIRSDVYSLGVVLFELLTGQLPHDVKGLASHQAARMIREEPPRRISRLQPTLHGDIESIVHSALQKDRQWRSQSAVELSENIHRFLDGQPIIDKRPTFRSMAKSYGRAYVRRHPAWSFVGAVGLAILVTNFIVAPVAYRWTPMYEWYSRRLESIVGLQQLTLPFEHVRILRITPAATSVINEVARKEGFGSVDWSDRTTMRPVHGLLARRLAGCGAKCLAFDITFGAPSTNDQAFCDGIDALRASGTPVIAGFKLNENGTARFSSVIAPHVSLGWCRAGFDDEQWHLETVLAPRSSELIPSLALATIAAIRHPDQTMVIEPRLPEGLVRLRYYQHDPAIPSLRRYQDYSDTLHLSAMALFDKKDAEEDPESNVGLREGDVFGISTFAVPAESIFDQASFDYEWALTASPAELRKAFQGKVIVLGYAHPDLEAFTNPPNAKPLPRMFVFSLAIESFLRGRYMHGEWDMYFRITLLVAAMLGAALGCVRWSRLFSRPHQPIEVPVRIMLSLMFIIIIVIASLVASVLVYGASGYVFSPLIPLACMALAAVLTARVQRIRLSRLT